MTPIQFRPKAYKRPLKEYLQKYPDATSFEVLTEILIKSPKRTISADDTLLKEDMFAFNQFPEVQEAIIKDGKDPKTHGWYPVLQARSIRVHAFYDDLDEDLYIPTCDHDPVLHSWKLIPYDQFPEKTVIIENECDEVRYTFKKGWTTWKWDKNKKRVNQK